MKIVKILNSEFSEETISKVDLYRLNFHLLNGTSAINSTKRLSGRANKNKK